jgi:tight adherence protein B
MTIDDQGVLVSVLVFLLIAQAILLATSTGKVTEKERVAQRLSSYTLPTWEGGLNRSISVLRRRRYSRLPWLDHVLARLDLGDSLALQLQQAGLPLRAGEFLFVQLMVATLGGLAGALLAWQSFGGPVAAIAGALLGFVAPLAWLRFRIQGRRGAFEQGLPDALDRVTGALRAGYGLEYGFDLVARDGTPPCSEEFGQILQELNLGGDLEEALARLVLRVNSEDARLLATAVAVQRRTGGNLIEVLGQMGQMLRERERLRRDVRVLTTAPRVSGYVVALLPLLTVVAMYFTSRYYIDTLMSDPIGQLAAGAGAVLVVVGLYLNHRIAQVEL